MRHILTKQWTSSLSPLIQYFHPYFVRQVHNHFLYLLIMCNLVLSNTLLRFNITNKIHEHKPWNTGSDTIKFTKKKVLAKSAKMLILENGISFSILSSKYNDSSQDSRVMLSWGRGHHKYITRVNVHVQLYLNVIIFLN